jgi:hypothetical protein
MARTKAEGDYRYSNNLVYNNSPWPVRGVTAKLAPKKVATVEKKAQAVLDVRSQFP